MSMMQPCIEIYGAGLAGCEAAWQAAERGVRVRLYEMKPHKYSPAHHSEGFAELVCSNSLRSDCVSNAVGLLKEEMRRMGSLVMEAADATRVPAGSALAVDRVLFSKYITDKIASHPNIEIIHREVESVGEGITVVATGPLTSDSLSAHLIDSLGCGDLHFFDAAAPIVDFASINMDVAYFASRYDKGDADYVNCPMTREQYDAFYEALVSAEEAELKAFDRESQKDLKVFEGCMPVEVMAARGFDTLRYGPMKPVGLPHPETGREAYAVVQLRRHILRMDALHAQARQGFALILDPGQDVVFRQRPPGCVGKGGLCAAFHHQRPVLAGHRPQGEQRHHKRQGQRQLLHFHSPPTSFSKESWISCSVRVSTLEVASSRISIGGRHSMTRAMHSNCFCPWDKLPPDSPIMVS